MKDIEYSKYLDRLTKRQILKARGCIRVIWVAKSTTLRAYIAISYHNHSPLRFGIPAEVGRCFCGKATSR